MSEQLRACYIMRDRGYKPYAMQQLHDGSGRTMEVISLPFPDDAGGVSVMVREKDDPTTMVEIALLSPQAVEVLDNQF